MKSSFCYKFVLVASVVVGNEFLSSKKTITHMQDAHSSQSSTFASSASKSSTSVSASSSSTSKISGGRLAVDRSVQENETKVLELAKRMKFGLDTNKRTFLKETKDGIKIFYPSEFGGVFGSNGLPIARIAEVEINASVEKVSELWLDQANRKEWDSTLQDSQTHTVPGTPQQFHYIVRKPISFLSPGRNFVFQIVKKPGAILGITDFNVITFASIDSSELLPTSWSSIRGRANSILVLQPIGLNRTKATYFIEIQPGGWFWIPSLASFAAGDNLLGSLSCLKSYLEFDEMKEFEGLSVEEAARRKFAKDQARAANRESGGQIKSLLDDVVSQKEDLQATLKLLEKKLADVQKMEKSDGLDLSELKGRIVADIAKAKKRLQSY